MTKLNEEICEFIGAFIGDGHFGCYGKKKNRFLVGFVGDQVLDEDYLVNYMVPLIKRNFPYTNPRVYYRTDENTIRVIIYSKKLFFFLAKLGFKPGVKSRTVYIPNIIYKNENLLDATLRGIFDTDGCIFFDKRKKYKKPYPRITLEMYSIPLILQINEYLSNFFSIYVNKRKTRESHILEIYGHQQLEKFLKQIGFSNKRHLSKCSRGLVVRSESLTK